MKAFIFVALAAVLFSQFTDALPRPKRSFHFSNGALRFKRSATEDSEHDKVMLYGINALLKFGRQTMLQTKVFFEGVIEDAETSDFNLYKEIGELKRFNEEVQEVEQQAVDMEYFSNVFKMIRKSSPILYRYEKMENLTPKDIVMKRYYRRNGFDFLNESFYDALKTLRQKMKTRVQTYFDSLTRQEIQQEQKFFDWFNKFKREDDNEKNLDVLFEFFDFFN